MIAPKSEANSSKTAHRRLLADVLAPEPRRSRAITELSAALWDDKIKVKDVLAAQRGAEALVTLLQSPAEPQPPGPRGSPAHAAAMRIGDLAQSSALVGNKRSPQHVALRAAADKLQAAGAVAALTALLKEEPGVAGRAAMLPCIAALGLFAVTVNSATGCRQVLDDFEAVPRLARLLARSVEGGYRAKGGWYAAMVLEQLSLQAKPGVAAMRPAFRPLLQLLGAEGIAAAGCDHDAAIGLLSQLAKDPAAARELVADGAWPALGRCLADTRLLRVHGPAALSAQRLATADPAAARTADALALMQPLVGMLRGGVGAAAAQFEDLRYTAGSAAGAVRALLIAGRSSTAQPAAASAERITDSGSSQGDTSGGRVSASSTNDHKQATASSSSKSSSSSPAAAALLQLGGMPAIAALVEDAQPECLPEALLLLAEVLLDRDCRAAAMRRDTIDMLLLEIDMVSVQTDHKSQPDWNVNALAARCLGCMMHFSPSVARLVAADREAVAWLVSLLGAPAMQHDGAVALLTLFDRMPELATLAANYAGVSMCVKLLRQLLLQSDSSGLVSPADKRGTPSAGNDGASPDASSGAGSGGIGSSGSGAGANSRNGPSSLPVGHESKTVLQLAVSLLAKMASAPKLPYESMVKKGVVPLLAWQLLSPDPVACRAAAEALMHLVQRTADGRDAVVAEPQIIKTAARLLALRDAPQQLRRRAARILGGVAAKRPAGQDAVLLQGGLWPLLQTIKQLVGTAPPDAQLLADATAALHAVVQGNADSQAALVKLGGYSVIETLLQLPLDIDAAGKTHKVAAALAAELQQAPDSGRPTLEAADASTAVDDGAVSIRRQVAQTSIE